MTLQSLIVVALLLFVIGFCILIANYLNENMLPNIRSKLTNTQAQTMIDAGTQSLAILDEVFIIIAVGMVGAILIAAYLIHNPAAFFFFGVFMLAIIIIIIPTFANMFQDVTEDEKFSGYTGDYPFMMTIMQNLPSFIFIFGVAAVIILFGKWRGTGGI